MMHRLLSLLLGPPAGDAVTLDFKWWDNPKNPSTSWTFT